MTVHCSSDSEELQESMAEAFRTSIMPQPIDLPKLEELTALKGDRLGRFLLPGNGDKQQARRIAYTHEVLSGIGPNGKLNEERDGFAIGVRTGLERGLGWKGAAFNLLAYSMTCGIFNLPRTAAVLGVVPFVFLVVAFQYMTWITGMAYSRLQARYPGVYSVPDAVHLIYGDAGRSTMSAANLVFAILLSGNHIILGSYAFRALGWKSCAVLLNFIFTVLSFFCSLPRSYRLFANLAFISALSVIVCMIVASVAAHQHGPYNLAPLTTPKRLKAFGPLSEQDSGFLPVVMAIADLFFAFGAHPCFFPLMGEMHRPEEFPKALAALITIQTTLYLVMTGVVLRSLGEYVTSPILASLSPSTERLCYILALPAIAISGCTSAQVSGKQLYISALRRMPMLKKKTSSTWLTWIFINIVTWTSAWILAELVPFFSSFMAVESSLIWTIYIALGGVFALFLKMHRLWTGWKNRLETLRSLLLIMFCVSLSVAGLWSAVRSISDSYQKGAIDYPFSCKLSSGLIVYP